MRSLLSFVPMKATYNVLSPSAMRYLPYRLYHAVDWPQFGKSNSVIWPDVPGRRSFEEARVLTFGIHVVETIALSKAGGGLEADPH